MDASVSLQLIPTRINSSGEIETLDADAIVINRGRMSELRDVAEQQAVSQISAALGALVVAKGY